MRKRTWYKKYIGYCFNDGGAEVILEDVCYFEDENGNIDRTGYDLYYPATGKRTIVGYSEFMRIRNQTHLPK